MFVPPDFHQYPGQQYPYPSGPFQPLPPNPAPLYHPNPQHPMARHLKIELLPGAVEVLDLTPRELSSYLNRLGKIQTDPQKRLGAGEPIQHLIDTIRQFRRELLEPRHVINNRICGSILPRFVIQVLPALLELGVIPSNRFYRLRLNPQSGPMFIEAGRMGLITSGPMQTPHDVQQPTPNCLIQIDVPGIGVFVTDILSELSMRQIGLNPLLPTLTWPMLKLLAERLSQAVRRTSERWLDHDQALQLVVHAVKTQTRIALPAHTTQHQST